MHRKILFTLLLSLFSSLAWSGPKQQAADSELVREWQQLEPKRLKLKSEAALIADAQGNLLYTKDADEARPIASITKLMTAMVVLDAKLNMQEPLEITRDDRDLIKLTGSRLQFGSTLSREEMLQVALLASDNRAAAALARNFPGGKAAFVEAMNAKAQSLGMLNSQFADPAGLDPGNLASPRDLLRMVMAAADYPAIRQATTNREMEVRPLKRKGPLRFGNTNRLLRNKRWQIELSKTGYTNEAGRCLTMLVEVRRTHLVMVFLDAYGKLTPFGDANRTLKWLNKGVVTEHTQVATAADTESRP